MKKTHEWTKKQTQSAYVVNFGKKYIGQPNFLKLIGNVDNKKVLELGSGNGYWLNLLNKKGAICTGIEYSQNQIDYAESSNNNITYIKGDITQLEKLKIKTVYDIIIINHVLLEITTLRKLKKIFSESFKLLKKGGHIVIADLHPFAPSLQPKNIKTSSNYNYFLSGEVFHVISQRIDGKETLYQDIHWTLSDIIGSITDAGFKINKIIEPKPTSNQAKKYPELAYRLITPMSLMIRAVS